MIVLRNKEFANPKNIDRLGKVIVYGSAGALLGGLGVGRSVGSGLFGVATGALGGYLGSDKNTRTRLKKRRELEERLSK